MPSMCPKCPEVPGHRSPFAPYGTSHSPKRSGKCTSGARPPGTWPNGSPPSRRLHPRPLLQPIAQRHYASNEGDEEQQIERRGNILLESAKL